MGRPLRPSGRSPRYLAGYGEALVSGELVGEREREAAEARWGNGWREKLASARERKSRG